MTDTRDIMVAPPPQRVDVLSVATDRPSMDAGGGGGGEPTTPISTVLRRRWATMLIVTLLTAGGACGAILHFVRPQYQVEAVVQIAPVVRHILFQDAESDISRQYDVYVNTESLAMVSPPVVLGALSQSDVRSLPLLVSLPDAVVFLQNHIKVERVSGTQLLRVRMMGEEPKQLASIVNAVVRSYMKWNEENKHSWDDKILRSLRKEEADLNAKLTTKNGELRALATEDGLSMASNNDQAIDRWINELQGLLTKAVRDRAILTSRLGALNQSDADGPIDPRGFEEYTLKDQTLVEFRSKLKQLELSALEDARMGRGPDHPDVAGREVQMQGVKAAMETREHELREQYKTIVRHRLEGELLDAQADVKVFQEELDRLTKARGEISKGMFVLEDVRHERERLEAALIKVRETIWKTEVEQNRMARVTLDSPAEAPAEPNVDKRLKFIVAACLMSLFLGAGAALVKDRLDRSVRDPLEVGTRLGMPLLGSVQRVPGGNGLAMLHDKRVLEPLRGIAAALLSTSDQREHHRWLMTSPTARSGKTSMAINLARCLASTGRRVLLVDADNVGQGVTRSFELTGRPGLNELLSGATTEDGAIVDGGMEFLKVLPAGKREAVFGDRVTQRGTQAILRALFEGYDSVIVDSPPVLMSSHAVVLATLVDDVVLVLRAGKSKREEAISARRQLATVGGKLVGVILNAVESRHAPYSYYGYSDPEENGSSPA